MFDHGAEKVLGCDLASRAGCGLSGSFEDLVEPGCERAPTFVAQCAKPVERVRGAAVWQIGDADSPASRADFSRSSGRYTLTLPICALL